MSVLQVQHFPQSGWDVLILPPVQSALLLFLRSRLQMAIRVLGMHAQRRHSALKS